MAWPLRLGAGVRHGGLTAGGGGWGFRPVRRVRPEDREILDRVAASGLPNLFLPRLDHFVEVDKPPLLGTAKQDLREIKRIAVETLTQTGAGR